MARPTRESIDTFTRITGASESVAVRKLEEYGGNLDGAINSYFVEDDKQFTTVSPRYNFTDTSIQRQPSSRRTLPLLSAARSFKPSRLLDPNYRRNLLNKIGSSLSSIHDPQYLRQGEFNNGYEQPYHSGPRPTFDNAQAYHSGPRPTFDNENGDSLSPGHQFHENVSMDHQAYMHNNDIEEQLIQHAIEASKQERQLHLEDDELAHAISLSLKTAEHEKATRELMVKEDPRQRVVRASGRMADKKKDSRFQLGSSSSQGGAEDLEEQSLWGCISSKELDEAMLLEAALFGENPGEAPFQPATNPNSASGQSLHSQREIYHPSPSLMNQRLLREQQDNEYFASLLADREKETSASKKPETSLEGEAQKKVLKEEECERLLAAKEASLPREPEVGDGNAVTLLVRMPDGSRCSRRFLKSDKLQFLFDFIDIGRMVKPQTYVLVRPYPRCTFSRDDSSLSLHELGLTNKQEALYLESV